MVDYVNNVIEEVERKLNFDSHGMLRRIALIESDYGTHPDTYNHNFVDASGLHSIGIWQITETCLNETRTNPNLDNLRRSINQKYGINWKNFTMNDMRDATYNCLAAYLYIKFAELAWPEDGGVGWPNDLRGQATKWKHQFNRNYSHGLSIEGFIKKCRDNGDY